MAQVGGSESGEHGVAAEAEARRIAARLGLADFVYKAEMVGRGGGIREPGDALVYANGLGAIVQVKSRDPRVAGSDSAAKVQQWIDKHGEKASKQATGTRRELIRRQRSGAPVLALPVRASHLPVADQQQAGLLVEMDVDSWSTIIVIDHSLAKGARSPLPADVFWITLDDWQSLHEAIRSTTGVLTYVQRVLAADPTPRWTLGTERDRYAAFVKADRVAAAASGSGAGYFDSSVMDDPAAVEIYRDVLRRVWPEDGRFPSVPIDQYRLILEHLDSVPPGQAAALGHWIYRQRQHLSETRSPASGFVVGDGRLLVYLCDHHQNHEDFQRFDAELMALMATRCSEVIEQGGEVRQACGVGVIQGEGWLEYRYAFMSPPIEIPHDVRLAVQQLFGAYDAVAQTTRPVR